MLRQDVIFILFSFISFVYSCNRRGEGVGGEREVCERSIEDEGTWKERVRVVKGGTREGVGRGGTREGEVRGGTREGVVRGGNEEEKKVEKERQKKRRKIEEEEGIRKSKEEKKKG
jgi:hypothetical protein